MYMHNFDFQASIKFESPDEKTDFHALAISTALVSHVNYGIH